MRKEIPKDGTCDKYGGDSGRVGIDAIRKHGAFAGMHFREFRMVSLIEGGFVYAMGVSRFTLATTKKAPMLAKIEN